jgi:hypothetical protein
MKNEFLIIQRDIDNKTKTEKKLEDPNISLQWKLNYLFPKVSKSNLFLVTSPIEKLSPELLAYLMRILWKESNGIPNYSYQWKTIHNEKYFVQIKGFSIQCRELGVKKDLLVWCLNTQFHPLFLEWVYKTRPFYSLLEYPLTSLIPYHELARFTLMEEKNNV